MPGIGRESYEVQAGAGRERVAGLRGCPSSIPVVNQRMPLLGGPVGPGVRVDPAGGPALDAVVADRRGGVQRAVDVVLGEVQDERLAVGVRRPSSRAWSRSRRSSRPAAPGVRRRCSRPAGCAPCSSCRAGPGRGGRTRGRGRRPRRTSPPLAPSWPCEHVLEERGVEVHVLVDRAVERPDVGGGAAAAGRARCRRRASVLARVYRTPLCRGSASVQKDWIEFTSATSAQSWSWLASAPVVHWSSDVLPGSWTAARCRPTAELGLDAGR